MARTVQAHEEAIALMACKMLDRLGRATARGNLALSATELRTSSGLGYQEQLVAPALRMLVVERGLIEQIEWVPPGGNFAISGYSLTAGTAVTPELLRTIDPLYGLSRHQRGWKRKTARRAGIDTPPPAPQFAGEAGGG